MKEVLPLSTRKEQHIRIELKYNFSCPSSNKLRTLLEKVIAEEGLPLAIESINSDEKGHPVVRIHSSGAAYGGETEHEISCENHGQEEMQFLDKLRGVVIEKWADHAGHPRSKLEAV